MGQDSTKMNGDKSLKRIFDWGTGHSGQPARKHHTQGPSPLRSGIYTSQPWRAGRDAGKGHGPRDQVEHRLANADFSVLF